MARITIQAGNVRLDAELDDSATAQRILDALPLSATVNVIGRVVGDATRLKAVEDGETVCLA